MPVVYLRDLTIKAKHGVRPGEKEHAQRFVFHVEVTINSAAGITDDLADTLDYSALRQLITKVAQGQSFDLLDRWAQAVGDRILEDDRVQKVVVAIEKPDIFDNGVPGVRLEVTAAPNG